MPSGRIPSALALVVILVAFTSVYANVCVLGTEPDPVDGGRIKLVLTDIYPCACTEVRLGGHNVYAPPRPHGAQYIDMGHLNDILAGGLHRLYHCMPTTMDGVSTDTPREPVSSTNSGPKELAADCQKILDAGQTTSGVYTIQHAGQNMAVYCRMESGKGYIVFQRRMDGSVSFNRTWQEYTEGFGNLTGEFWLGNQQLTSLTGNADKELVITLRAFDGDKARVRYEYFTVSSFVFLYISGFIEESGHAGNSLSRHGSQFFSTRDYSFFKLESCARRFHGGWWYYDNCHSDGLQSNLNGLYYNNATVDDYMGIQWVTWKGNKVSLQGCEMMIRPKCTTPVNCQQILDAGQTTSGVYTIQRRCHNMTVYCRMESGKGYIVFQRRMDGSVSFDRTRQEYAEGFGDLTGEFWLGNYMLNNLVVNSNFELVITLRAFDGDEARVRYKEFVSTYPKYPLLADGFSEESGHAGDSLGPHNRAPFSTRDDDNDDDNEKHCAREFHAGWWYKRCGSDINDNFKSNLNGLYYNNATVVDYMGIQWVTWKGNKVSLKGCEMMIQRKP